MLSLNFTLNAMRSHLITDPYASLVGEMAEVRPDLSAPVGSREVVVDGDCTTVLDTRRGRRLEKG